MKPVLVTVKLPFDDYNNQIGTVVDFSIASGHTKFNSVPDGSWVEVMFDDGEQFSFQKKHLSLVSD